MALPTSKKLQLPVEPYDVAGYRFGQVIRRRWILWATHLGDDIVAPAGTEVKAIGDGEVVWSETRRGDEVKRNWGGVVVVRHSNSPNADFNFETFYSVYGHMRDLRVKAGDRVQAGQVIGVVGASNTPENGWWKVAHIHFGIYTGPWRDQILPGYKRVEESRTKVKWWREPRVFIERYNKRGL